MYDQNWPIRTHMESLPPAKFVFRTRSGSHGMTLNSLVSGGCIISSSRGGAIGAVPARAREFIVILIRQSYCQKCGWGAHAACAAA